METAKKHKFKLIIGLVVLLVIGGVAYKFLSGGEQQQGGEMPPQEVSAITLKRQTVDVSEEFPGRTSAYAVSEIRPQVSGIIQERLFTEGSQVKKGQQLYQIDAAPFRASYNSAKAALAKAEAAVVSIKAKEERYKELVKIEAVSKQEYEDTVASLAQAQADIAVQQAAVQQEKINLDYTKVYAPIDGRISKSTVTSGALVQAGQAEALAIITQLDPIYVDITQSSDDMQRLRSALKDKEEQEVTLIFNNAVEYAQKGKLQFTDITVDPTTNSVSMRALFPNTDGELLPGLFVRAKLDMTLENALPVPQKATSRASDGTLTLWVIGNDDTVQPQVIEAKRTAGDQWLVTGGVEEGARIVTEGMPKLQPGAKVKIATPKEEAKAEPKKEAETSSVVEPEVIKKEEPKVEAEVKEAPKPEPKVEPKAEVKEKPKKIFKPEPKETPKEVPQTKPVEEPKPATEVKPVTEVKPETEVKEVIKPEITEVPVEQKPEPRITNILAPEPIPEPQPLTKNAPKEVVAEPAPEPVTENLLTAEPAKEEVVKEETIREEKVEEVKKDGE